MCPMAMQGGRSGPVRPSGAWCWRFRRRRTDTLFRLVPADSRKRRWNASCIRRAHPRAPLSSSAIRVGPYKDRARARDPTSARDCACVRTCDRPTQSQRHLSDANGMRCCPDPEAVLAAIRDQQAALRNPPRSASDHPAALLRGLP